ncbi:TIGR03086 family metal-binding protein [Actinoalloteichus spitiensis]|uniref:TIGR03086 family metal-binding protein n=1 Tax=Actinoalloteichus spitiensis TaxID=252394 RepID=UPI0003754E31|nr:TIGR03086 family metal-binding protein [Actinoalloteichus spitiensis]
MSIDNTTGGLYRRLAATFTERVRAVPASGWESQSPCVGWTARDVLAHVVDTQNSVLRKVGIQVAAGPTVETAPLAAWEHTRDAVQDVLDDPMRANRAHDTPFGRSTLAATIGAFYCFDLVVHAWDIAKATGGNTTIPPENLEMVAGFMERMGDTLYSEGVCQPPVPVVGEVNEQTRILALLGRTA